MHESLLVGARGIRMVAIGTETGVWMGIEGDTNNLCKVLPTDYVTQIGVLEEYHVFLVLSGKERQIRVRDQVANDECR